MDQLALWNSLRHDLERARMLVELVRKREKLKREQLRLLMTISELQLRPLNFILKKALDRIARKDPAKIFADPVSIEDVSFGMVGKIGPVVVVVVVVCCCNCFCDVINFTSLLFHVKFLFF